MKNTVQELLCCPYCKGALKSEESQGQDGNIKVKLFCAPCKKQFEEDEGHINFLGETGLVFSSKREKFIRSLYAKAYTPITNFMFLFCGGVKNAKNEVLSRLNLKKGSLVLETGMGTGENLLWMHNHAEELRFFGVDIQKQMINSCTMNLKRWNIEAELFHADAQELPFRDETFDVVFHLGAINLFSDKKKAIEEMIRVAKPGTHIVIADETEKAGKLFRIFTGTNEKNEPPLEFIPDSMLNKELKIIWRGYGYLVEFDKP